MNAATLFLLILGTGMTLGSAFLPFPSILGFIGTTTIIAGFLIQAALDHRDRVTRWVREETATLDQHRKANDFHKDHS